MKLSSVIGAPFRGFVVDQLRTRAIRGATQDRTLDEVLYLANQMAWVKLSSSVKVQPAYLEVLKKPFANEDQSFNEDWTSTGLAQNWILQAGTSKTTIGVDAQGNTTADYALREGIGYDGAYGLGGIQAQGYRPMPGLTNVHIETAGRLGSLRFATINFKVWNMNQLDIIDTLYFRLGYTMLLEWGHVQYFPNIKDAANPSEGLITNSSGITDFFTDPNKTDDTVKKEDIQFEINQKIKETQGNYDGMLGVVCNFNYSFNQDGGWDCSIKLIGLGSIMETQKINISYLMPANLKAAWEKVIKQYNKKRKKELQDVQDGLNRNVYNSQYNAYYGAGGYLEGYRSRHPVTDQVSLGKLIAKEASANNTNPTDADAQQALNSHVVVTPNFSRTGNALYYYRVKTGGDVQFYKGDPFNKVPIERGGTVGLNGADLSTAISGYVKNNFLHTPASTYLTLGGLAAVATGNAPQVLTDEGSRLYSNRNFTNDITKQWYYDATRNHDFFGGLFSVNTGLLPSNAYFKVSTIGTSATTIILNTRMTNPNRSGGSNFLNPALVVGVWVSEIDGSDYETLRQQGYDQIGFDDLGATLNALLKSENGFPRMNVVETKITEVTEQVFGTWQYPEVTVEGSAPASTIRMAKKVGGAYQLKDAGNTIVKWKIKTSFLQDLSDPTEASPETLNPFTGGGVLNTQADFSSLSDDQTNMALGFESSLQSILTYVKYDTIVNTPAGNYVYSIVEPTAQFLTAGVDSVPPIAAIIKNNKFEPASIKGQVTGADLLKDPVSLCVKGNSSTLMQNYNSDDSITVEKVYNEVPDVDFDKLCTSYIFPKNVNDSVAQKTDLYKQTENLVYIKFGYLLMLLDSLCLLYDTTKNSPVTTLGNTTIARPLFYIDYNPETNFCFTMPSQLSIDPEVCLIPFSGTDDDYKNLFLSKELTPTGSLFTTAADDVSPIIQDFHDKSTGTPVSQGKTMNILLNVQYLLDIIRSKTDRDDHNNIYLQEFLERIVADINKSIGDVNAFRVSYNDASNTVVIVDDQAIDPSSSERDTNILNAFNSLVTTDQYPVIMPYDQLSLLRNFQFQTETSTKMSSVIAIGAQAENSGAAQSTDASSFSWLNRGLVDRVITKRDNASKPVASAPKKDDTNLTLATKFNTHVLNIYNLKDAATKKATTKHNKIYREMVSPARNFLIQSATRIKALDENSTASMPIPLNAQLTMPGISGIIMGNGFILPKKILPITLRGTDESTYKYGFMVIGLDHNIESNQWTTNIKGQIIKIKTSAAKTH